MRSCKQYIYLCAFLLSTVPACAAYGQAVHPEVYLEHPTPFVTNDLGRLQVSPPRVALLYSERTASNKELAPRMQQAVRAWEYFLTGLQIPYEVLFNLDRRKTLDAYQVLIIPAAEQLSDREIRNLVNFVDNGGGILATGRIGWMDTRGRSRGPGFYASFFGVEAVTSIPDTMSGLLQSLPGGHPPTDGLIPGFRLNIVTPRPFVLARVTATGRVQALGRPYLYYPAAADHDPLAQLTFITYGTYGSGRFFWSLFNPQDVSRESEHQRHYQAMVLNALAYVSKTPQVAVAPWPHNHLSATAFVVLPTPGAAPANTVTAFEHTLQALRAAQLPATFFLLKEQAPAAINLLTDNTRTELVDPGTAGDTYTLFKGLPLVTQRNRLEQAIRWFRQTLGSSPRGFHPPGNLYDVSTVWAMQDVDLAYIYAPQSQTRSAPADLAWLDQADWREPISPSRLAPEERILDFPLTGHDDYYVLQELGYAGDPARQLAAYRSDFERTHRERGLYILPFHAENQALTSQGASVLTQLGQYVRNQRSWVASLGEIHTWWRNREKVQLRGLSVQEQFIDVNMGISGLQRLEGVSLIYRPGAMRTRPRTQPQTQLRPIPDGYLIGLPTLDRRFRQLRIFH